MEAKKERKRERWEEVEKEEEKKEDEKEEEETEEQEKRKAYDNAESLRQRWKVRFQGRQRQFSIRRNGSRSLNWQNHDEKESSSWVLSVVLGAELFVSRMTEKTCCW